MLIQLGLWYLNHKCNWGAPFFQNYLFFSLLPQFLQYHHIFPYYSYQVFRMHSPMWWQAPLWPHLNSAQRRWGRSFHWSCLLICLILNFLITFNHMSKEQRDAPLAMPAASANLNNPLFVCSSISWWPLGVWLKGLIYVGNAVMPDASSLCKGSNMTCFQKHHKRSLWKTRRQRFYGFKF